MATDTETIPRIDAAALVVLAGEVLGLGLPEPGYITVSPHAVGSLSVPAIGFQFNGADRVAAVAAWADEFAVATLTGPDSRDLGLFWVSAEFTYSGVRVQVYAPPDRGAGN